MGTVSTGTGILSPLTVGSGGAHPAVLGSLTTQANLTGSWALDLKGDRMRHLDLQMLQSGELIVGRGRMTADAAEQDVAVAGSVAGDSTTAFVTISDPPGSLRLRLSASGASLAGEYDALMLNGERETGTVTGSIASSTGQSRSRSLGTRVSPSATEGAFVGSVTPGYSRREGGRSYYQST